MQIYNRNQTEHNKLNREIAIRLFDWKKDTRFEHHNDGLIPPDPSYACGTYTLFSVPTYCEDIRHAWAVITRLDVVVRYCNNRDFRSSINTYHGVTTVQFIVTFSENESILYTHSCKNGPLAICRTCIKLLNGIKERKI